MVVGQMRPLGLIPKQVYAVIQTGLVPMVQASWKVAVGLTNPQTCFETELENAVKRIILTQ